MLVENKHVYSVHVTGRRQVKWNGLQIKLKVIAIRYCLKKSLSYLSEDYVNFHFIQSVNSLFRTLNQIFCAKFDDCM